MRRVPRIYSVLNSIGGRHVIDSMKILVILLLVAIVGSLGCALYFMFRDQGKSRRAVKALAVRVGLSFMLFILLMAGYYFGWIPQKIS